MYETITVITSSIHTTHRQIISESGYSKPILDLNYSFPMDLARIGSPIGAKSIKKWLLQSKFGLV